MKVGERYETEITNAHTGESHRVWVTLEALREDGTMVLKVDEDSIYKPGVCFDIAPVVVGKGAN